MGDILQFTLPTGGTGPSFVSFRDGIGGGWSRDLFGFDFSSCPNWPSFTATALNRIERLGSEAFEKRVRKQFGKASTGESALVLAILFAVDYRRLADKLCEESGRSFLQYLEYTHGRHLLAVLACLLRED